MSDKPSGAVGQWIAVADDLPKPEEVLGWVRHDKKCAKSCDGCGHMEFVELIDGETWIDTSDSEEVGVAQDGDHVAYWMYLPHSPDGSVGF